MLCVIVFVDLDGTLWDHEDISSLIPPFKRLSEFSFADSRGVVVNLNKLAERGFIVFTLS